jgi:hypothetical protein
MSLLTTDKITTIFCIADDFCKEFSKELAKMSILPEISRHGDVANQDR